MAREYFLYNPETNCNDVYYTPEAWEAAAQSQQARGITPNDSGTGSQAEVIEFFAKTNNSGRPGNPSTFTGGSGGANFFK